MYHWRRVPPVSSSALKAQINFSWLPATSEAFTSMLLAQGVQVSMDGRGRCMDNVFVERLWRSIKYEEVYLKAYQNGTEARKGIGAYLAFYNQERPHQTMGYRSPGQVFQAVSPQRCLLEHPRALHRMKVYETPQR